MAVWISFFCLCFYQIIRNKLFKVGDNLLVKEEKQEEKEIAY
jgi:hypothetical protein